MYDDSNGYSVVPETTCNEWSKFEIVSADEPEVSVVEVDEITSGDTYIIESWYWYKYLSSSTGVIYGSDKPTQWEITEIGDYYYL